jgi:hypothetical protein
MAGVPRAAGVPDYTPSGVVNFDPEIYSGKLVEKFYKTTVFGEIATTDYEGDIVGFGAQVRIRTVPDITVSPYIIGAGLTAQYPSSNAVVLAINQAYSFNVALSMVDARQSDLDLADVFANDGSIQLKIQADLDMLTTIPTQVASFNTGATAGQDSGNLNLGSVGTSVQLVPTGATGSQENVVDFITYCGQALDETNVSDEGRWLVATPWFINLVKRSNLQIASLAGDGVSILRNGKVGMIDRFNLFQSRNVQKNVPGGAVATSWSVMFGHPAGLAFAAQIVEAQMIDNPSDFGWLIRGLMVFGFQTIQSTYLGTGYVHP